MGARLPVGPGHTLPQRLGGGALHWPVEEVRPQLVCSCRVTRTSIRRNKMWGQGVLYDEEGNVEFTGTMRNDKIRDEENDGDKEDQADKDETDDQDDKDNKNKNDERNDKDDNDDKDDKDDKDDTDDQDNKDIEELRKSVGFSFTDKKENKEAKKE